jgi:cytochrome P450
MKDVVISGHHIPKNTIVTPQISCVLTDGKIFENASEFRPERFTEKYGINKDLMDQVRIVTF